jgi:hypothetical protein
MSSQMGCAYCKSRLEVDMEEGLKLLVVPGDDINSEKRQALFDEFYYAILKGIHEGKYDPIFGIENKEEGFFKFTVRFSKLAFSMGIMDLPFLLSKNYLRYQSEYASWT